MLLSAEETRSSSSVSTLGVFLTTLLTLLMRLPRLRLKFSVLVEMKIGALLPPTPPPPLIAGVVFAKRNCWSLARCLSFKRAAKESGLLRMLETRKLDKMLGTFSASSSSSILSSSSSSADSELLMTELLTRFTEDDNDDALAGLIDELATTLLLLLNKLAEAKFRLELLKATGEAVCNCELTGVAMSVGVTSLRVIMATVVLLDLERMRLLGLTRVRNKLGLMTGVKVLLGRVKVRRDLGLEEDSVMLDSSTDLVSSAAGLLLMELEAKVKSSSSSLKPPATELLLTSATFSEEDRLGVTTRLELGVRLDESASPEDSNSGTELIVVVSSLRLISLISSVEGSIKVGERVASMASIPMPMEVGRISSVKAVAAGKMSVLVSSRLVMTVLSPSMEVVQ